jgi:hypothetical protein
MSVQVCYESTVEGQATVTLLQHGCNKFSVQYGKQSTGITDYNRAAMNLGSCLMHALACAGKVDNR